MLVGGVVGCASAPSADKLAVMSPSALCQGQHEASRAAVRPWYDRELEWAPGGPSKAAKAYRAEIERRGIECATSGYSEPEGDQVCSYVGGVMVCD